MKKQRGDAVLRVDALARSFGGRKVIAHLDLLVDAGRRVALVGPNGSGKTTFVRCVAGTLSPTAGTISIAGAGAGSLEARARVGSSLAQERSFYVRLTGWQNLSFFARLRMPRSLAVAQVRAVVEELEIDDIAARRVDRCSTGMVQQLALARAFLGTPSLLLLDEPTRSLDDAATARLWTALERRPHLAVVIATHRRKDIDRCDDTLVFPT